MNDEEGPDAQTVPMTPDRLAEIRELLASSERVHNRPLLTELVAEVESLAVRVADYERGLNWGTTCLSCAKTLESSYTEYVRAGKAEAEVREAKSDAWDEAMQAIAWAVDREPTNNFEHALTYCRKNNPHRAAPPVADSEGGERDE